MQPTLNVQSAEQLLEYLLRLDNQDIEKLYHTWLDYRYEVLMLMKLIKKGGR
jgi:hypothetical protein